jgi:adenylate kinase
MVVGGKGQLPKLRLAITGTPGTGKTALSTALEGLFEVIELEKIAEELDLLGEVDDDDSRPLDVEELVKKLDWQKPQSPIIIEGHLSHLLPVDAIIVMRCHPEVVDARLSARSYSVQKIQDNVEVEMLGGPWFEIPDDIPVLELDSGSYPSSELSEIVVEWLVSDMSPNRPAEVMDWLDDMASDPS